MTQAQKTAKAKFKQAIAYRQKTGVSLKEAFAHIYGKKKVGVVKKKSAPKKKVAKNKKAKKKVYGIKSNITKAIRFTKGAKNQIKRSIKKIVRNAPEIKQNFKRITRSYFGLENEQDLLLKRIKESISDLRLYENILNKHMSYPLKERKKHMSNAQVNYYKKLIKETGTHIIELKKSLK